MKKHKHNKTSLISSEITTILGAWILASAALIGMTENLHARPVIAPASKVAFAVENSPNDDLFRREGNKESARLPEELDVGLRMPGISGRL